MQHLNINQHLASLVKKALGDISHSAQHSKHNSHSGTEAAQSLACLDRPTDDWVHGAPPLRINARVQIVTSAGTQHNTQCKPRQPYHATILVRPIRSSPAMSHTHQLGLCSGRYGVYANAWYIREYIHIFYRHALPKHTPLHNSNDTITSATTPCVYPLHHNSQR